MPQTVQQAISAARIILDEDAYRLIYLPPRGITAAAGVIAEVSEPFCALIVDQQEITLVLEQEAYEEYRHRLLDHRTESAIYRLITFDVILEPTLTGFMAAIAATLAERGIAILPFAAFSRDHLLVTEQDSALAMAALQSLQATMRQETRS
jgi:hypothetical protein